MPSQIKPNVYHPPVVDEWGIYDPERAGLAAVFEKVEERRLALAALPRPEPRIVTAPLRGAVSPVVTRTTR